MLHIYAQKILLKLITNLNQRDLRSNTTFMLLAVTAARVYMGTLKEEKAISMMNRIKLIAKAELV